MGWTSYHRPTGETDRAHFERELLANTDYEIVESATVKSVFYAAVRTKATDEVWALVVLLRRTRGHYNFSRKELSETMGPVDANAPAKVLDALTPTDNEYALEWRKQCRANLTKRVEARKRKQTITVGTVIQTAVPLHFGNGLDASRFEYVQRSGRTTQWNAITHDGTRFLCRLRATWAERYAWEIVPSEPAERASP